MFQEARTGAKSLRPKRACMVQWRDCQPLCFSVSPPANIVAAEGGREGSVHGSCEVPAQANSQDQQAELTLLGAGGSRKGDILIYGYYLWVFLKDEKVLDTELWWLYTTNVFKNCILVKSWNDKILCIVSTVKQIFFECTWALRRAAEVLRWPLWRPGTGPGRDTVGISLATLAPPVSCHQCMQFWDVPDRLWWPGCKSDTGVLSDGHGITRNRNSYVCV